MILEAGWSFELSAVFAVSSTADKRGEQRGRRHVGVFVYRRAAPHPPSDSPRGREQGERAGRVNASQPGRMFSPRCRILQRLTQSQRNCVVSALVAFNVAVRVDLQRSKAPPHTEAD